MLDRFTDSAKRAMNEARRAAHRLGHECLSTEHVLLGLLEVGGTSATVLSALGVDPVLLRQEFEASLERGTPSASDQIPFTKALKTALERTLELAVQLNDREVGTEHLLFGLAAEGKSLAAQALLGRGVTVEAVRRALDELGSRSEGGLDSRIGDTQAPPPYTERVKRLYVEALLAVRHSAAARALLARGAAAESVRAALAALPPESWAE